MTRATQGEVSALGASRRGNGVSLRMGRATLRRRYFCQGKRKVSQLGSGIGGGAKNEDWRTEPSVLLCVCAGSVTSVVSNSATPLTIAH